MPDTEVFKLIVNGGSFAMLILIGCWALFRLEPRIREMMEKKDESHMKLMSIAVTTFGDATQKVVTECSAAMKQQTDAHAQAVSRITIENRALVESMIDKAGKQAEERAHECRDERKEWMEAVMREGELNRKARHDLANQFQTAIAELYGRRDPE